MISYIAEMTIDTTKTESIFQLSRTDLFSHVHTDRMQSFSLTGTTQLLSLTSETIAAFMNTKTYLLQAPCVASEKVIVIDDKFVASRVF